jgi:hypothetical protein
MEFEPPDRGDEALLKSYNSSFRIVGIIGIVEE